MHLSLRNGVQEGTPHIPQWLQQEFIHPSDGHGIESQAPEAINSTLKKNKG